MNDEELVTRVWDAWMQELDSKADKTKTTYLYYFEIFRKRWEVTPSVLYEMRKTDFKSGEPLDLKRIERMVKTSMAELKKAGYAASTCSQVKKATSSFFDCMGMELHFKTKDIPKGEYKGSIAATVPQIRKMYEEIIYSFLCLRNRAVILSLKETGLRVSDLSMMNYGCWLKAETIPNEHGEIFKVFDPEETIKMKILAYIHLGPESVAAIEEYLKDRQDRGEILTEESPLFLNRDGNRLSRVAMSNIFVHLVKKLKYKRISAHSLRKFHKTRLEGAGMNTDWINKLQGKKADEYSQPEVDPSKKYPGFSMLTEKFIDGYDALRVLEKPKDEIERALKPEPVPLQIEERFTRMENIIGVIAQELGISIQDI